MVKKNLDLELQALHMIQQRNGVVPKVFESEVVQSNTKTPKSGHQNDEEKLLKEVIKLSEEEYRKEKDRKKEIERMEKTLALSSKEESERLFQQAEDELRNMERMVSLTLKLEANSAAEKSGTKKTPRTESPRQKDNVSSPRTKQRSSKSGTKSPPKEKTKSASPTAAKEPKAQKTEPAKSVAQKTEPAKSVAQKTEPAKSVAEPAKQKTKDEEPKSVPVSSAASAGSSKAALKRTEKTTEPLPALRKPAETPADAAKNWLSSAMAEANTPSGNIAAASKAGGQASMDDQIAQRAQYMRMQREKLLNLKKQERTKRLNTFEEDAPKRPMSSRVARRVTAGTEAEKPPANEIDEQQQKKLALRRALASRLKKEVINAE
ncbi:Hypothetical predicted protein [Paramuricea clavata]|uniref:Uncharacterized protein n=1 Tax=Paramuricea clavata TaxID=317549 RepID=A0A7D9JLA9_PARCT|nr:Hypothetical predicted protein [Paramuricea clavata]